jgi:hypothetical protein
MTLIVSWIGVDSRKISSLYIAGDSRISWADKAKFDNGKKIFGCKNHPVIIGYCGDVQFPSLAINQIVELADNGLLFPENSTNEEKFFSFNLKLKELFDKYPSEIYGVADKSLEIIFASRNQETDFLCTKIKWLKSNNSWTFETLPFSKHSDKIFVIGSGKKEFEEKFEDFLKSNEAKTSRAVFQCFCETLENINDTYCGGAPQLVGLYNRANSQQFGIVHQNKLYLNGFELESSETNNKIEWRNKLFEICDGNTKLIKPNAQRQPRTLVR